MATVAPATVDRLRRELGDRHSGAFSDPELAGFLVEAGGDFDSALLAGLTQMHAEAALLHSYSIGGDREEVGEVFDNLGERIAEVEGRITGWRNEALARPVGTISTRAVVGW